MFFCAFCDMLYQMEDDCRLCRRCVTDLYQRWVSIPRRNSLVSHEMVSGGTAGGVWRGGKTASRTRRDAACHRTGGNSRNDRMGKSTGRLFI